MRRISAKASPSPFNSIELAPLGITVNNICPGAIETPINKDMLSDPKKVEPLLAQIPRKVKFRDHTKFYLNICSELEQWRMWPMLQCSWLPRNQIMLLAQVTLWMVASLFITRKDTNLPH